ncbi:Uncharacterised protein g8899 [Pycnogonum litorale]
MKGSVMSFFRHCSCFRPEAEDIQILDFRHSNLTDVPDNVFTYERTLEELNLDANQIRDLPRPLFHCHGLKKLSLNDNEIESLPPAIASLINLEELDISKNSVLEFPDNIKGCKHLHVIDASVNPLGKLPDGLTQLVNLTQLYLNDTFLEFLPANFGRLSHLQIVELRENRLNTLPKSMARLVNLKRLDIGQNEFYELPEVIGSLQKLTELWCDSNKLFYIQDFIGNLKQLNYLDASCNRIQSISYELDGCDQLQDLYLSYNKLKELPESIGNLKNLQMLKLDENRIRNLPRTIGKLSSLQELVLSVNDLSQLPPSIGLLRKLGALNVDENYLECLPPEIGSCVSLTILSVRTNRLQRIPHELGHIPRLRVLNISDNFIKYLPFTITRLTQLSAIWISENQNKPLVPFQSAVDPETGQRVLTCILLPQIPREDLEDGYSDGRSTMWEERQNKQIKFASDGRVIDHPSSLVRLPTPYPKEMKAHAKHAKNLALKHCTISAQNSMEENDLREKLIQPGDVISSVSNTTSLPAVAVKEAVIAKPKSPLLSNVCKPSSPHLQVFERSNRSAEHDVDSISPTLHVLDHPEHALSSTTQSADSGMASVQHSDLTITSIQTSNSGISDSKLLNTSDICVSNQASNHPSGYFKKNVLSSSKGSNFKHSGNRNLLELTDRGYRSDNEFYSENDRNATGTPDGYYSDWETMVGRSALHYSPNLGHHLNPKMTWAPVHASTGSNVSTYSSPKMDRLLNEMNCVLKSMSASKSQSSLSNDVDTAVGNHNVEPQNAHLKNDKQTVGTSRSSFAQRRSPAPGAVLVYPVMQTPFGNGNVTNPSQKLMELRRSPVPGTPSYRNMDPHENSGSQMFNSNRSSPGVSSAKELAVGNAVTKMMHSSIDQGRIRGPGTDNLSPANKINTFENKGVVAVETVYSSANSPVIPPPSNVTQVHNRQPPDYNTALQRSSLYSKFHGPIDVSLGTPPGGQSPCQVSPIQGHVVRQEPKSRLSQVSDSASVLSSTNSMCLDRIFPTTRSPSAVSQVSESSSKVPSVQSFKSHVPVTNPSSIDCNSNVRVNKNPTMPPPLPPKPLNLCSVQSSNSNLTEKQLDESVYKELYDINSRACNNERSAMNPSMNDVDTHKAVLAQVVSDCTTNVNKITPSESSATLGFTPISPAPNMQQHNQIVRPAVPSQQQIPVKTSTGRWVFGAHKNPKVFPVVIEQNPDIGFTITTKNSQGIYVDSVALDGPASSALMSGDKILQVDGIDFTRIDRDQAACILNSCKNTVCLMISRE